MTISEPAVATQGPLRRPLVVFLVLGLVLSWYPWVLHLMGWPGNGGPNPLGLLVAAVIAAFVDSRWRGIGRVLRSIVRLRAPWAVWSTAIVLPFAALGVTLALASYNGVAVKTVTPPWSDLLDRFVFTLLFVALGEEPSWRGFLLPLLERKLSAVAATLFLSLVWAIWHLPLMGSEFAWPLVPAFLASLVGGAFVLSWLYNASGSVLPPMAMHAFINTAGAGYVFTLIGSHDLLRFWTIYAAVWLGAGILAIVFSQGRLGLTRA